MPSGCQAQPGLPLGEVVKKWVGQNMLATKESLLRAGYIFLTNESFDPSHLSAPCLPADVHRSGAFHDRASLLHQIHHQRLPFDPLRDDALVDFFVGSAGKSSLTLIDKFEGVGVMAIGFRFDLIEHAM